MVTLGAGGGRCRLKGLFGLWYNAGIDPGPSKEWHHAGCRDLLANFRKYGFDRRLYLI